MEPYKKLMPTIVCLNYPLNAFYDGDNYNKNGDLTYADMVDSHTMNRLKTQQELNETFTFMAYKYQLGGLPEAVIICRSLYHHIIKKDSISDYGVLQVQEILKTQVAIDKNEIIFNEMLLIHVCWRMNR